MDEFALALRRKRERLEDELGDARLALSEARQEGSSLLRIIEQWLSSYQQESLKVERQRFTYEFDVAGETITEVVDQLIIRFLRDSVHIRPLKRDGALVPYRAMLMEGPGGRAQLTAYGTITTSWYIHNPDATEQEELELSEELFLLHLGRLLQLS